jgi:hypothetical protein
MVIAFDKFIEIKKLFYEDVALALIEVVSFGLGVRDQRFNGKRD